MVPPGAQLLSPSSVLVAAHCLHVCGSVNAFAKASLAALHSCNRFF